MDEEKEIFSECSICFQPYKADVPARTPKLLPCAHTFCVECLEQLILQNSIQCPNGCGTSQVSSRGAEGLKSNFALIDVLPYLGGTPETNAAPSVNNSKCENCCENDPTLYCTKCDIEVCSECSSQIHSMGVFKKHKPVPGGRTQAKKMECKEHEGHILDLYCKAHKETVCILCREYGKCNSHIQDVSLLQAIISQTEDEIKKYIIALQEKSDNLYILSHKFANVEKSVDEDFCNAQQRIDAHYTDVIKSIEARKCEKLEKLQAVREKRLSDIRDQRDRLVDVISRVTVASEHAKQLTEQLKDHSFMAKSTSVISSAEAALDSTMKYQNSEPPEIIIIIEKNNAALISFEKEDSITVHVTLKEQESMWNSKRGSVRRKKSKRSQNRVAGSSQGSPVLRSKSAPKKLSTKSSRTKLLNMPRRNYKGKRRSQLTDSPRNSPLAASAAQISGNSLNLQMSELHLPAALAVSQLSSPNSGSGLYKKSAGHRPSNYAYDFMTHEQASAGQRLHSPRSDQADPLAQIQNSVEYKRGHSRVPANKKGSRRSYE